MSDQWLEERMARRLAQFDATVALARQLFEQRNRGYRDAIRFNGLAGVLFEWAGIAGRLKALRNEVLRAYFAESAEDRGEAYGAVSDKLMDAVVYGIIGIILLNEGNILGEE